MSNADRLRLTYAYVDATPATHWTSNSTARNSGSAGWLREWGQGWYSALFYYGDDALNDYRFERVDMRIAKRIAAGQSQRGAGRHVATTPRQPAHDLGRQQLRQSPRTLLQRGVRVLTWAICHR